MTLLSPQKAAVVRQTPGDWQTRHLAPIDELPQIRDRSQTRHRALPGLIMLLLLALAPGLSAAVDTDRLRREIRQGMQDWQIPGMAVAVIDGGEIAFAEGFGSTALRAGTPVDRQTFFINASTTKAMVAAGLLLLVDEGKVALDDPVIDYLPQLHFGDAALTPQVTLRDLLTHRTGLPSTNFWTFNQGMSMAEQLPRLRHVEPVAPPRARKIYQNTMYEIVGMVIERVSDAPWEVFVADRLWRPIGMRTVATRNALPAGAARVRPHELRDGELREVNHSLRGDVSDAAGSAWSSVDDMLLWLEFLLRGGVTRDGERLLSEAAVEEMFTPQQLVDVDDYYPTAALTQPQWISYGLGWYQQDFQGRKIDFHTGSLNGATAIAGLDRSRNRGVIVLSNRGGAELRHALLWSVLDDRVADERRDWPADVLALYESRTQERELKRAEIAAGRLDIPPSLALDAYAGDFDSPRGGPLAISRDGDALRLDTRVRTYRLTPWHADIFQLMHEDWSNPGYARFSLTPQGTIDAIEVFGMVFERLQPDENPER